MPQKLLVDPTTAQVKKHLEPIYVFSSKLSGRLLVERDLERVFGGKTQFQRGRYPLLCLCLDTSAVAQPFPEMSTEIFSSYGQLKTLVGSHRTCWCSDLRFKAGFR